MKLRQNARELVLLEIDGLGLILGEIRYNKQTETAIFALEKGAFFDLYLPCAIVFDPQKGPLVRPHVLNAMTTGSIRVQRSKVSCFVLGSDLAPSIAAQYRTVMESLAPSARDKGDEPGKGPEPGPEKPTHSGPRIINLPKKKS